MKQRYEDLCKRHGLPDLRRWIDVEDETTTIDLRVALQEKLYGIADLTAGLLSPDGYGQLLEAQVFSEDEHDALRAFHDRVALLCKDCALAELESTEQEELALVQRLVKAMPGIVAEAKRVIERTKTAYSDQQKAKGRISYLG